MDASGLLNSLKSNPAALALSIVLHAIVLILLGINLSSNEVPEISGSKQEIVKAVLVDASIVEQEIKKLKQAEIDKKNLIKKENDRLKRKIEKEKKRLADIKREQASLQKKAADKKKRAAADKKAAMKKKALADKKAAIKKQKDIARKKAKVAAKAEAQKQAALAKAEAEKQAAIAEAKAEADAKKRAEEEKLAAIKKQQQDIEDEKRRVREEQQLKQEMQEEALRVAKHNDMLASLREQYVRLIEQKVERNWLRPVTVNLDYSCEVFVTQSVLGDVLQVKFGSCAGDQVFRNSIERAVRKSSPLPPPPNPEVFDREIRFVFKPDT